MLKKHLTFIGLAILILSAGHARSEANDRTDTDPIKTSFKRIFNGKDLTGWDGDPAFWSVRDGIITAKVDSGLNVKNHSYLIWNGGEVRDFELRVAIRSSQGNSGIDYRAEPVSPDRDGQQLRWTIKGYQSDIAEGWMGSLYNWGRPGAQPSQFVVVTGDGLADKYVGSTVDKETLYGINYFRQGQWNQFTIIARGSHILHRINGYPIVEAIDNSPNARRQGVLGLQVHAGRKPFFNEYKEIRIKQFNTNFGKAVHLFNGKDLSGWTFSNSEADSAWVVENEALVNKSSASGYICTKDDYINYVLRFQYRRRTNTKGAVLLCISDSNKYIRINGKADDFDRITSVGYMSFKRPPKRAGKPAFRNMPANFWNECEILLNDGRLEITVNDVLRATVVECGQIPGRIGFEDHGSGTEYRNIVIIPILSD